MDAAAAVRGTAPDWQRSRGRLSTHLQPGSRYDPGSPAAGSGARRSRAGRTRRKAVPHRRGGCNQARASPRGVPVKRLGILISGRGSNFEAIANNIAAGTIEAEIAVV